MEVKNMSDPVKMRKQFILDPMKIKTVRRITKAKTETEAVDKALDMVIANSKIENLLAAVKGKGAIKDIYGRASD